MKFYIAVCIFVSFISLNLCSTEQKTEPAQTPNIPVLDLGSASINVNDQMDLSNSSQIRDFAFLNSNGWMLLTNYGSFKIFKGNSQNKWSELNLNKINTFYCINFLNDTNGWMVDTDGGIWRTSDGAGNWIFSGNLLTALKKGEMFLGCENMQFTSVDSGWIVETLRLFRTFDGGKKWIRVKNISHNVSNLFFLNEKNGWLIAGDDENNNWIYITSDAGNSWVNYKLENLIPEEISFVDLTEGWIVDRLGSVFSSKDGGKTWVKLNNLPKNFNATSIAWSDLQTGWVAGYSFEDERKAFPKNGKALLLYTTDKGKTWLESDIPGTEHFFSKIKFTDKNNGMLSAQNSFFLTADGGKNWTLIMSLKPRS